MSLHPSANILYHSSHPSMDALYRAVQHAAFAQGYAVRRARTTREKAPPPPPAANPPPSTTTTPAGENQNPQQGQFNRIEIWCRCGGKSTATVYRSRKTKTGCPFKAIGSLHKAQGDVWLLRVVDGTHNHRPDEALCDDAEYRAWFRGRSGGAWELEGVVSVARMMSVEGGAAQEGGGGGAGDGNDYTIAGFAELQGGVGLQ